MINEAQKKQLKRLLTDFPFYAKNCLVIRPKDGAPRAFELNRVQAHIHELLEEQKKEKGYVRALILKGRQMGCSTFVAGRFYHQVTQRKGCKAFILAHREDATNNLYNLAKRFNDNCPPLMKPSVGVSNAKSLYFDKLDSGYAIGTAGGGTVGRSDTIQLLHASEAAFYENTDELASGIFQTVADAPGTEIIIESTANGQGNMFHKMCMDAIAGRSEYMLIFIPWFWDKDYSFKVDDDFILTEEEQEYKSLHNLTNGQIAWRRNKISNFGGDIFQFKKEYPATALEAFEFSGEDNFIRPEAVVRARKNTTATAAHNLIVGIDPAWMGNDKTVIVYRYGRVVKKIESYEKLDLMQITGLVSQLIYKDKPFKIFLDVTGIGAGIYDRICELGYADLVMPINFGGKADQPERYFNKRAEMYGRLKEWLEGEIAVRIPDDDNLAADIGFIKPRIHSSGKIMIESKEDIKKKAGRSPDISDALALTFAYIVPIYEDVAYLEQMYPEMHKNHYEGGYYVP